MKYKLLIFIFIVMGFATLGSALFPTIDTSVNSRYLDDGAKTYPHIDINDWFGFGGLKASLDLERHTATCGESCMSQFSITIPEDNSLVDDVKFYTLDGDKRTQQDIRSYQFYIQTEVKEIEVPDYEWICGEEYTSLNGTKTRDCENKQIGTHMELTPEWVPYSMGTIMSKGTYTIKLEGEKKPSRSVDWVIETQGKVLSEWATWGQNGAFYNYINETGLVNWYKFENNGIDSKGGNNLNYNAGYAYNTTSVAQGTYSLFLNGGNGYQAANIGSNVYGTGNRSFCMWVNPYSFSTGRYAFGLDTGTDMDGIYIAGDGSFYVGEGVADSGVNIPLNTWTHLCYVYNGDTHFVKMYVNGTQVANTTAVLFNHANGALRIGAKGDDSSPFLGNIDEFAVWNRTIQDNEILNTNVSSITLNSPIQNYISPSNQVTFNATAIVIGGGTLINMSLWTNSTGIWKLNQTINSIGSIVNDAGDAGSEDFGSSGLKGEKIKIGNQAVVISSFTKYVSDPSTIGYVYTADTNISLGSCSFSGVYCNFTSPIKLNANTEYKLMVNAAQFRKNTGATPNYPQVRTYFNWTKTMNSITSESNTDFWVFTYVSMGISPTSINQAFSQTLTSPTLWGIQACDSDGDCGFSENRTVSFDTQAPTISLLYPTNNIAIASYGQNISLNYSINDAGTLQTCFYNYNGTTNVTIPCASNSTLVLGTQKSIIMYANDSVGNFNSTSFNWDYDIFENSHNFNTTALETTSQGYIINTTINTTKFIAQSASLIFNNTAYSTTKSYDGINTIFSTSVDLPAVSATTNKNVTWQIEITNSTSTYYYNTSIYNQTISKTNFIKCPTVNNGSFINFTVYSQTIPTLRVNTTFSATFNYWGGDGSIKSSYTYQETGTPTNSSFNFCLEPASSTINIDADIQYGNVNNYAQNYFYYRNKQLTNATTEQPLYLLNSSLATITTLRTIDSYQNSLVGYIGYIYLHDVGTNTDKLVGMFKTNYNGQDIAYLNWYDSLYKFTIYDSNITTLKYTAEPFKVSSTPQTFRIDTLTSGIDWLKFQDVTYSLTANNNTRTFLLTFNDPNSHLTAGCLRIIRLNNGNGTIISDECINSTSGTLTYTVPEGLNGTYYGVFYGKGSIGTIYTVIMSILDVANDVYDKLGNLDATVLAIMVVSLFAGIGFFLGPAGFIIMCMVGYIVTIFLGFQRTTEFQIAFFSLLAVGVYLVWKLRN